MTLRLGELDDDSDCNAWTRIDPWYMDPWESS